MDLSLVRELGELGCHESALGNARKFHWQGDRIFHLFQSLEVSPHPTSLLDIFANERMD